MNGGKDCLDLFTEHYNAGQINDDGRQGLSLHSGELNSGKLQEVPREA